MNAYKKYLKNIDNVKDFRIAFGDLARNARGWMDLSFDIKELPNLIHEDMEAAYKMAASMLNDFFKKERKEKTLEYRLGYYKKYKRSVARRKHDFLSDLEEYGLYESESEELVSIIHGGDLGRINAAIRHDRGYATDTYMPNLEKFKDENTGLMFHSQYPDRAHYYARSAASQRVGIQAILVAKVPMKYLYHNQGDEYSLPTWHYQYMTDIKIMTEFDEEFWNIETYYRTHYLDR